jgi:DNA polymerase-3 subunit gamma/tau
VKIVPAVADDRSLAEIERTRGRDFAAALSMRVLARTWQMLFKGLPEVQTAAKPIAAAEMVLVRIAYAADLPTPDELVRALGDASGSGAAASGAAPRETPVPAPSARFEAPARSAASLRAAPAPRGEAVPGLDPAPRSQPAGPTVAVARFEDLITLAGERRDLQLKTALERDVRLVRFEDGKLEIALEPNASKALIGDLPRKLTSLTGRRWMVVVSAEPGQPTVRAQLDARRAEALRGVQAHPLVQTVLERFPGAEIVAVRQRDDTGMAADQDGSDEDLPPEPPIEDDARAFGEQGLPDDTDDDF